MRIQILLIDIFENLKVERNFKSLDDSFFLLLERKIPKLRDKNKPMWTAKTNLLGNDFGQGFVNELMRQVGK